MVDIAYSAYSCNRSSEAVFNDYNWPPNLLYSLSNRWLGLEFGDIVSYFNRLYMYVNDYSFRWRT